MNEFDPVSLLRPAIRGLRPFSSARGESADLASRSDWVWLDANESPWPPHGDFAARARANRYTEPQPEEIRSLLAGLYRTVPEQVLLCRGSEEIPDLLIRSFCQPCREGIVLCPPTFGVYEVAAAVNESPVRRVQLRADRGYDIDTEIILKNWQQYEKLIFIPSPNAPMGHRMPATQIDALLEGLLGRAMVVVDQAYVEFSGKDDWTERLAQYPHLVVLRTLSKAFGLAGIRLGALLATPSLVRKLAAVMPPYPISALTIEAVKQALTPQGLELAAQRREILIRERERLIELLPHDPAVRCVYPSESNFLLVQTNDPGAFIKRCLDGGIVARNRHGDLANTVRITIGQPEENDRLLAALKTSTETI